MSRVCNSTVDSPLDIKSAHPSSSSTRIAAGPSEKAVTALGNSVSRFVDPGPENTQANEMYKKFINTR